jgi:DNA-directed RNA polymerase specialized sigma24 family protein
MYSKDMSRWQDEVTAEEWESWQRIARNASHGRNRSSYNSSQDLESNVMEKLFKAEERPENIEAWIRRVTTTTYIDMWRARSKFKKEDIDDFQVMQDEQFLRAVTETMMGPKTAFMLQETVNEVLGFLSEKHQKLVLMSAAGFTSAEIAEELAYASPQAVSNQLRRIQEQIKTHMESTNRYSL